jgi:hypothetical protein
VKALIEQNRKIAGNPSYLKSIAQKYVPKAIDASTIDSAAQKYVDLKLFDVNGGLNQADLDYTAKFFGPSGAKAVDKDMAVSDFADLTYLNQVINELGQQ